MRPSSWLIVPTLWLAACANLTRPDDSQRNAPTLAQTKAEVPKAPKVTVRPVDLNQPEGPTAAAAPDEKIRAAHILIAYSGALHAAPSVTRTKDAAQVLASRVRNRAKFEDFGTLARTYSDDATTKEAGGDLGLVNRAQLASLADAAFKLKPGGLDVVESDFGFHIIRRAL